VQSTRDVLPPCAGLSDEKYGKLILEGSAQDMSGFGWKEGLSKPPAKRVVEREAFPRKNAFPYHVRPPSDLPADALPSNPTAE
jgi:hypothetical protein